MLETDVLIVGGGNEGIAAAEAAVEAGARALVLEKLATADDSSRAVRAVAGTMVLDIILSDDGEVAGALVVDEAANEVRPVRAKSVVIATGGIAALYPGGELLPAATGDGFAMAHRAGADLADFRVAFGELPELPHVAGGVVADPDGATRVPGLFVAGAVAVSRAVGSAAGLRAAHEAPREFRAFGDYAVMPNIDSPLPRGFAQVKMERLRALMMRHLGPDGPKDLERGRIELHKLKGEADDFARARVDAELLSFKNACEVAVLLANAAAGPE